MKKQIEGLLGQLSKAQLDAKAISARLTELENELAKKAGALMSEIKVSVYLTSLMYPQLGCKCVSFL